MKLNDSKYTGISGAGRALIRRLARLHRPFTVAEATATLKLPRRIASRLLAHWTRKEWLVRLRRGLYVVVPIDTDARTATVADPWVVIATAFAPCYIGGWTACEHWGFTEQLFRRIVVFTSRRVLPREGQIAGEPYLAKRIPQRLQFGTRRVWREQTPINVSDPHRTVVDILDAPELGGGIRHVAQVVSAYFLSEHRGDTEILSYATQLGNRTVFKRLGFLIERLGIQAPRTTEYCLRHLSEGYSRLDPKGPAQGRLLRRWKLLINVGIGPAE